MIAKQKERNKLRENKDFDDQIIFKSKKVLINYMTFIRWSTYVHNINCLSLQYQTYFFYASITRVASITPTRPFSIYKLVQFYVV